MRQLKGGNCLPFLFLTKPRAMSVEKSSRYIQ